MDSLLNLKDFQLDHKNPSPEALRRWRSAVSLVKNRRRRFRMVADLDKRNEAEQIKQGIKVSIFSPFYFNYYLSAPFFESSDAERSFHVIAKA